MITPTLKLTTEQHLASVRKRLETGDLSDQERQDLAVIALFYQLYAQNREDRVEAAVLFDWAAKSITHTLLLPPPCNTN